MRTSTQTPHSTGETNQVSSKETDPIPSDKPQIGSIPYANEASLSVDQTFFFHEDQKG